MFDWPAISTTSTGVLFAEHAVDDRHKPINAIMILFFFMNPLYTRGKVNCRVFLVNIFSKNEVFFKKEEKHRLALILKEKKTHPARAFFVDYFATSAFSAITLTSI